MDTGTLIGVAASSPAIDHKNGMKSKMLFVAMLLCTGIANAQVDPTIMTIGGQPVTRSEFEYSYNKNNTEGVIDKKSVDEYVDLFVNYKLKVMAAEAAHLDTLSSFKQEFATYRDQQIRPTFITEADVETEARRLYAQEQHRVDNAGGLVKPAHILIGMHQKASQTEQTAAKQRADSIYNVLKKGGDFGELAKKYSSDAGSASNGGELSWIGKGQTLKEFDEKIFSMQKGELSKPFLTAAGYHIVILKDKSKFFPYDTLRADILKFIDQRGLREEIINHKLDSLAKAAGNGATPNKILADKRVEMESKDVGLRNLIREYHDGLLLYEISNREVWDKAAKNEAGIENYFKKHKKRYKWDTPRFRGIAYCTKKASDVKAVKECVKNIPFDKWAERLRKAFNNDSILRIRVEKGIFRIGDNALVDREVFKKDTVVTELKGYPYTAVYGQKLKAPKNYNDVRSLVLSDYQEELERQWLEELRKKYPVVIDKHVLATVNKHE